MARLVTLDDVENFHHLIQQRVQEQNKGALVQLTITIQYDDGTSVELNSVEHLRAYAEVRAVIIHWGQFDLGISRDLQPHVGSRTPAD